MHSNRSSTIEFPQAVHRVASFYKATVASRTDLSGQEFHSRPDDAGMVGTGYSNLPWAGVSDRSAPAEGDQTFSALIWLVRLMRE